MNGYILVGGLSTRMGQSKVPLFLDRVVAAARPVFDHLFAVQRAGGEAVSIDTIYEEPHADRAPAFGVACALRHANGDCFILAVDYPLVTSEALRYVEGRFRQSTAPLVAPRWGGKVQMLCAGYAGSLEPRIAERLASGRYDLRGLTDSAEVLDEVELRARFSGEPFMNVNTPEELQEAMRRI